MKALLHKVENKEDERVIIECVEVTPEIKDIYAYVTTKGKELTGICEGYIKKFKLEDVYYFEATDNKVFAYTEKVVYELKARLYEIEESYARYHFIRGSKSMVLNLMKLDNISPIMNGRFLARMKNQESIIISRQYVPEMKKAIMGGRDS